jgi:prepilin-type N-terminal cleavage/methylation domain-containing protein
MKNKGFTLLEMLTALIIMAIVAIITIPVVLNIITGMRKRAFLESEKGLIRAATNYLNFNEELYPTNIGDITEVSIDTLVTEEFVRELKNPVDGTMCSGYIMIKKIAEEEYEYFPEYKCGTSKTITSSTLDSLALNYNFDDFQEPTTNLNNNALFVDINGNPSTTYYGTWGFGDGNSLESVDVASAITGGRSMKATKVNSTGTGATMVRASYTHSALTLNSKSTYTVYAKGEGNSIGKYLRMWTYCNSATGSISTGITNAGPLTADWQRYEYTFTWTKSDADCYANGLNTYTRIDTLNIGDYFYLSNPQLELKPHSTPFVIGSRTGIVTDYSGNNRVSTLTMANTPRWVDNSRLENGSYFFDGTNKVIATDNTFSFGTNVSVCLWAKPSISSTKELVIHGAPGNGAFEFYQSGTAIILRGGGTGFSVTGNNALTLNQWKYVCGTISGTTGKVYSDGVLLSTNVVTTPNITARNLNIGAYQDLQYSFNGYLDGVRVYNRTLTDAEIATLYYIEGSR